MLLNMSGNIIDLELPFIGSQLYTAQKILEILFCDTIKPEKICKECPAGITSSATFAVDLNELRNPDDIKKMSLENAIVDHITSAPGSN